MPALRPLLSVPDVDEAVAFYRDKLGFELQFSLQDSNGSTFFASVAFAGCAILFSLQGKLAVADDVRRRIRADMQLILTLPANMDIDEFYTEVMAKGVEIQEAIADKFWGNREFAIRDPNGYCITYAAERREVNLDEAKEISRSLNITSPDGES